MAIYKICANKKIHKLDETKFEEQKVKEQELRDFFARDDNIEAIEENLMVVGKEVNVWQGSQRYIDLLCIDKKANLVVFEFKRTKTGEFMEWQALRYAAMVSALTFDQLAHQYARYLRNCDKEEQGDGSDSGDYSQIARDSIGEFLGYVPDDDQFGNKVRIVLVSAGFSAELTTTVLWLNENDRLDIRCVEIPPSKDSDDTFFEVRTIIPLPATKEYQVGIKERKEKAQTVRNKRSNLKFNLKVDNVTHENLPCNTFMMHLITAILKGDSGTQENIDKIIGICKNAGRKYPVFWDSVGELGMGAVREDIRKDSRDRRGREKRFYIEEDQLLHIGGRTYAISNGWYCDHAKKVAEQLEKDFDFEKLNTLYEQVEE